MDLSRALKIEGWMEPAELTWLAAQASRHDVIAEIGSYKGRSTRAMADHTRGVVVAIDDFQGPREIEMLSRHRIFDDFADNMRGLETRLRVIKADHRRLLNVDFQPDMVFIDGAHEYEAVKADIEFWLPRLRPRGLICGHDFLPEHFPSVCRAVRELLPDHGVVPNTSIWYQELP